MVFVGSLDCHRERRRNAASHSCRQEKQVDVRQGLYKTWLTTLNQQSRRDRCEWNVAWKAMVAQGEKDACRRIKD